MDNVNPKSRRYQQKAVESHAKRQDAMSFFNLLTCPELFETMESLLPEHRERLFPPTEALSMFLAQAMTADRSCQNIVNSTASARIFQRLPRCSTHTGGYCRARQRLPVELISALVRETGEQLTNRVPNAWRWHGRAVRIIDGTTITLPDTAANQAKYPQQSRQAPGLGFPICRMVGITCWSSGALLKAAIGPYKGKGSSEHALFRQLLPGIDAGDIILGDGLYGSFFALSECIAQQVDVVFAQNGMRKLKSDFRSGHRLGVKDHIIQINKPTQRPEWMSLEQYHAYPNKVEVREIFVDRKMLITTLLDPKQFPKAELKSLYRSRWQVELDFRNIKVVLGMDKLSCKTPDMAEKEIWVYFLAYNLVRILMAQTAELAGTKPRQLSFKHTLQLWLSWKNATTYSTDIASMSDYFKLASTKKVGNRPGRIEPRAVKRRPKPYSFLMEERRKAQARIRSCGHPPKQREWIRSAA